MRFGLLGVKLGMMRLFNLDGQTIPITLIKIFNNCVDKIIETDNYYIIKLLCKLQKNIKFSKSFFNYFFKNIKKRHKEYKTKNFYYNFILNKYLLVNNFYINQNVDITGISIGKGFSGVIKRHNFKSGRSTHGNSKSHNTPGSIGMNQDPGRVFPGKKLPGRLGFKRCTIQNLKIKKIDFNYNVFYIRGSIPGYNGNTVFISSSVK